MTTEVQVCINQKKWAKTHLEDLTKKEAFLRTLKDNINNLTKDIAVGTRFVSTRDYDGNLYECKYAPHEEYIERELWMNLFDNDGDISDKKLIHYDRTIEPTKLNITQLITDKPQYPFNGEIYIQYDEAIEKSFESGEMDMTKYVLSNKYVSHDVLHARLKYRERLYYERRDANMEYPTCINIEFIAEEYEIEYKYVRNPETGRHQKTHMAIWAIGYFPQIQAKASRIWVRKCNLVAEALGKNIDSSKKSINFTLKKMNVRNMLADEIEKLRKIRKIYNKDNPEKARSKCLFKISDELKRLEPTLRRMESLYESLCDVDIIADAYYCKKYGYLIPLKAKITVDLSGNTFETDVEQRNIETKAKIDEQIGKKNELISEIVPAVLHPDRVEKEIEKYGIDGVFGDDIDVVKNGVVNKSVFG